MNDDEYDREDDELEDEEGYEGVYVVDEETADLLATVIGIVHMMASNQLDEEARENLRIIAQSLEERFAIEGDSMVVEELVHTNPETGEEEVIYKPKGGLFGEDLEPEADSEQPE